MLVLVIIIGILGYCILCKNCLCDNLCNSLYIGILSSLIVGLFIELCHYYKKSKKSEKELREYFSILHDIKNDYGSSEIKKSDVTAITWEILPFYLPQLDRILNTKYEFLNDEEYYTLLDLINIHYNHIKDYMWMNIAKKIEMINIGKFYVENLIPTTETDILFANSKDTMFRVASIAKKDEILNLIMQNKVIMDEIINDKNVKDGDKVIVKNGEMQIKKHCEEMKILFDKLYELASKRPFFKLYDCNK